MLGSVPTAAASNHRQLQRGFTSLELALIVFAQAALPPPPAQRTLHNPAPWSHDKPLDMWRRFDDLHPPGPFGGTPSGKWLSAIGAISPDQLQARLQWLEPDQQASCPCLVGGIVAGVTSTVLGLQPRGEVECAE